MEIVEAEHLTKTYNSSKAGDGLDPTLGKGKFLEFINSMTLEYVATVR
jgi:hypothetical protein